MAYPAPLGRVAPAGQREAAALRDAAPDRHATGRRLVFEYQHDLRHADRRHAVGAHLGDVVSGRRVRRSRSSGRWSKRKMRGLQPRPGCKKQADCLCRKLAHFSLTRSNVPPRIPFIVQARAESERTIAEPRRFRLRRAVDHWELRNLQWRMRANSKSSFASTRKTSRSSRHSTPSRPWSRADRGCIRSITTTPAAGSPTTASSCASAPRAIVTSRP